MMNSIELFNYDLPSNLIATKPRPKREQAKLMIYNKNNRLIVFQYGGNKFYSRCNRRLFLR